MVTCIVVGAGGRGKDSYAPYIKQSGVMQIVGVAEPDDKKRGEFAKDYGISDEMCFADYRDLFARERMADAVMICTQDRMHFEPTVMAMDRGYHILLEKPISALEEEVDALCARVSRYDKVFCTGFVLRYTPFICKIKELLDAGEIGKVISVQHNENEGFWHHAHAYVRGQWNNDATSSPLSLSKSCHDFDLLLYLIGSKCTAVSSYGCNTYFKAENAPRADVPLRCTDGCPCGDTCVYNAVSLYTKGEGRYFVHKFECGERDEEIIEALKTNIYGRCVYRCDNNVCDHQVAALNFESGETAVFTLSAFTKENTRTIKIMGTRGEIGGCLESGEIVLKRFADMQSEVFRVTHDGTKHCGGDGGLMRHFAKRIAENDVQNDLNIFLAHKMAFAAERSRKSNRVCYL